MRNKTTSLKAGEFFPFSQGHLMGIIRLISKKEFVIVLLNTSDERITLETSAISECYDLDIKEFLKENELDRLLIEPEGIILLKKELEQELSAISM